MSDLPSSRVPALDHVYERVQPLAYPLVRIVTGLFLVPHGAQTLFGFAGGDINRTAAVFAKLGLVPSLRLRQGSRQRPWSGEIGLDIAPSLSGGLAGYAVHSGRSVIAADPHSMHRIHSAPLCERRAYTQASPPCPGALARALTEPTAGAVKG